VDGGSVTVALVLSPLHEAASAAAAAGGDGADADDVDAGRAASELSDSAITTATHSLTR